MKTVHGAVREIVRGIGLGHVNRIKDVGAGRMNGLPHPPTPHTHTPIEGDRLEQKGEGIPRYTSNDSRLDCVCVRVHAAGRLSIDHSA